MATYYVQNPGGNDGNPGSMAQPWLTMQKAFDTATAVAPDTVYLLGGETLAATIDVDINTGSAGKYINFIGVGPGWVDDGTRYVIDGNGAVANAIAVSAAMNYIRLKNIEVFNTTSDGIDTGGVTTSNFWIFEQCYVHTCGGAGIYTSSSGWVYIRCSLRNNTGAGVNATSYTLFLFCDFIGNGNDGITTFKNGSIIGCIIHANTASGVESNASKTTSCLFLHNVIDGNDSYGIYDINGDLYPVFLYYNRITNHNDIGDISVYYRDTDNPLFGDFNFYLNNDTNKSIAGIDYEGANSLVAGVEGYANRAGDEFDLTDLATLRRTAIQVGCA